MFNEKQNAPIQNGAGTTTNVDSTTQTHETQAVSVEKRVEMAAIFLMNLNLSLPKDKDFFTYLWIQHYKNKTDKKTIAFNAQKDHWQAARTAIEYNDQGYNIFFGVNLTDSPMDEHSRPKENDITAQTVIIADLDCKSAWHIDTEKKIYPTIEQAKNFLPFQPSILVDSGGGLHSYILLNEPIKFNSDAERQVAKERNKNYIEMIRENAKGYTGVDGVADLPRILRLPGTYNLKNGFENAPLCKVFDENIYSQKKYFMHELNELIKKTAKKSAEKQSAKKKYKVDDNSDFEQARRQAIFDSISVSALDRDKWFEFMSAAKGEGFSYSEVDAKNAQDSARYDADENLKVWNSITDLSFGIQNLYNIAIEYGNFNEKEFRREWKKTHQDSNKKRRPKVTPINDSFDYEEQANRPATTKAVISDCPIDLILPFPSKFRFTADGILRYVSTIDSFAPCCHTPVVITERFFIQPSNKVQYKVAFLNYNGKWQFVTLDGSIVADSKKIIQLADSGVGITSTDAKYLSAFLMELINFDSNKTIIPTQKIYSQIGWNKEGTKFILPAGGNLDGENYIVKRSNYKYEEIFATKGDKEKWFQEYLDLILHGAEIRLIFGAALASPLVKQLDLMNVWLHIHGTSNNGKTLVTKAAVSVFGNPELRFLGRTLDASRANFQSVCVGLNDYPKYFDEMESLPRKARENLPDWIYNYTGGITGQRNKRNGEERETSYFSGTIFTTGESPLLTDNSKRGAFKRLLEIKLNKLSDDQNMRRWHKFFEKNFGHFGADWIQYITENLDSLKAEFDELLADMFESDDSLNKYDATNLKVIFACQFALKKFFNGVLKKSKQITFEDLNTANDLQEILKSLPTIAQIDDSERAFNAVADFVLSRPKNFIKETTNATQPEYSAEGYETYGKIYLNGDVAFIPTQLTKIVEKELNFASCKKLLTEWNDNGKLDSAVNTITRVRKLNGTNQRVIHFKKLLDSAEETFSE